MTLDVLRSADAAALADAAARDFLTLVTTQQRARSDDVVRVVLTGGGIADIFHRRVAELATEADVDWARVAFWWGDERFVLADSEDRNAGQARRALLDHLRSLGLPERAVHEVGSPQHGSLADVATRYAATLPREPIDLVLLGIGPDGHVASLFPGHESLVETHPVVAVPDSPKPPPERVSLTFPTLNHAREVWILASGESKAEAVHRLLADAGDVAGTPARGVHGMQRTILRTDMPR